MSFDNLRLEIRYREIKPGAMDWQQKHFAPDFVQNITSHIKSVFTPERPYEFQCRVIFLGNPDKNQSWTQTVYVWNSPHGIRVQEQPP